MKKILITFLICFLVDVNLLYGHSIILKTFDNQDGTMEVFGGFSTGQSAVGAKLIIKSELEEKIIYEARIPISGTLIVDIPKKRYRVILDSGPGHKVEKKGDIYLEEMSVTKNSTINYAFLVTSSISVFFLLLSFMIVLKRTYRFRVS